MRRVSASPPRSALEEITEFVWGLDSEWSANGVLREERVLVAFLLEESQKRGRRGRDLRLPPKWDVQGIYDMKIMDVDGDVVVVISHRFALQFATFTSGLWRGSSPASLRLENNYSEQKAKLTDNARAGWFELLLPHFPCQYIQEYRNTAVLPKHASQGVLALTDALAVGGTPRKVAGRPALSSSARGTSLGSATSRVTSLAHRPPTPTSLEEHVSPRSMLAADGAAPCSEPAERTAPQPPSTKKTTVRRDNDAPPPPPAGAKAAAKAAVAPAVGDEGPPDSDSDVDEPADGTCGDEDGEGGEGEGGFCEE